MDAGQRDWQRALGHVWLLCGHDDRVRNWGGLHPPAGADRQLHRWGASSEGANLGSGHSTPHNAAALPQNHKALLRAKHPCAMLRTCIMLFAASAMSSAAFVHLRTGLWDFE
jgi:hypothetical protein